MSSDFFEVETLMQIREVAKHLDLTAEAIRYFEREGLVAAPARSENGYRNYGPAELERLRFIANCRSLEMSHDEIRQLIDADQSAQAASESGCDSVAAVVRGHMAHVEQRIAVLRELLKTLKSLDTACSHGEKLKACDVMRALSAPMKTRATKSHSHVRASHF
jgi:DNA-binding transcriptional MerR regulator